MKLKTTAPHLLACAALALAGVFTTLSATAQAWPSRPVRVVVPFPPGGASDIIARLTAGKFQEALGQSMVIENRAGANGMIGAELVAKAAPDGYTLLVMELGSLTISPSIYPKLGFDTLRDLTGVGNFSYSPHVLAVNANHPAKTVQELIAFGKSNPGRLTFATPGNGSAPHLVAVLFAQQAGFQWTHVPYKGGGAALADVAGGVVDAVMNSLLATQPFLKGGKLRALAVSSESRMAMLPGIPTVGEAVPGFFTGSTQGMLAPAGTPAVIVNRLNAEIAKIIQMPDIVERLAAQGAVPQPMSVAQFNDWLRADTARWRKVVTDAGVKLDQ